MARSIEVAQSEHRKAKAPFMHSRYICITVESLHGMIEKNNATVTHRITALALIQFINVTQTHKRSPESLTPRSNQQIKGI